MRVPSRNASSPRRVSVGGHRSSGSRAPELPRRSPSRGQRGASVGISAVQLRRRRGDVCCQRAAREERACAGPSQRRTAERWRLLGFSVLRHAAPRRPVATCVGAVASRPSFAPPDVETTLDGRERAVADPVAPSLKASRSAVNLELRPLQRRARGGWRPLRTEVELRVERALIAASAWSERGNLVVARQVCSGRLAVGRQAVETAGQSQARADHIAVHAASRPAVVDVELQRAVAVTPSPPAAMIARARRGARAGGDRRRAWLRSQRQP